MAGVGFSLRRLAGYRSYSGMLRLYGAASLISCGPWLLSVFALVLIGVLAHRLAGDPLDVERFQVSVTWLLASSLVVSSPLQLQLTRFVADRCYEKRTHEIAPNLLGAMALMSGVGMLIAVAVAPAFWGEPLLLWLLLAVGFITLCNGWLVMSVLTGLRSHLRVLASFGLGYLITLVACPLLLPLGELGLLAGFVAGQAALMGYGLHVCLDELKLERLPSWRFLERGQRRMGLWWIGLLYGVGIWADKLLFWFNPQTSRAVLGPFRASDVYDLPIFLAYLTIVPGMAVFLVKVETDFAERNAAFYDAVREGASLPRLERLQGEMVVSVRHALAEIGKVQLLAFIACLWCGPALLTAFGISRLHLPLLYVDALGVGLQMLLMAVISIFFYLDRQRVVVQLALLFLFANAFGTALTQWMGPDFYGLGFGFATFVTSLVAVLRLDSALQTLVQDTFMLQPVGGR